MNRYGNPINKCVYVNYVSADNPGNYNDVISSQESEKWREAMNKEIVMDPFSITSNNSMQR